MNRNENKNRVKDIDGQKYKYIGEKSDKVDEKTARNSQLIFDRDAMLHKVLWIAKIFVIKLQHHSFV